MKPFKTKQIFSLVLTVMMLFGLLPGGVTVNAETPNQITVSFAAYDGVNGVYLFAPQALTVTEGIAEQNDFSNSAEYIKDTDISALDALVAAHLAKDFPATDITSASFTTGMFGQRGASIGFAVNNLNPIDENSRGYAMNEYALKDGDSVLFYIYGDEYWGDYLSYFDQKELKVNTDEEFTLNLKGHSAMEQMWGTPGSPTPEINTRMNIPYASISVVDKESGEMGPGLMYNGADVLTDEDGNFTYAFSEPGEYILSATGFVESDFGDVPIVAPTCRVTVTAPPDPLPDYTGDWINFRGNDQNMGITSAQTPTTAGEAELKWGVKYATGFFANITPPIILNGDLYIAKNNTVLRIDKETGEMLAQSEALEGSLGFALNPITYGGGLIYVQIGTGRVQALRADTLESVWVSKPLASTEQTLSPITYRNGYIYTGTWGRQTGNYFCISVEDEDPGNPTEEKDHVWTLESPGAGFYWAGAYATDNYVIFGSDAGVLYSVHPTTGEVIDTIEGIRGEIRSTVSYDEATDRIYFSSKAGDFCQVKVNDDGTFDDSQTKIFDVGGMCTGTPLVYDGLAYIGMGGPDQFSPDGGHDYKIIDVNATPMKQVGRAEIPGYVQTSALFSTAYAESKGKVYVYCTYNAQPGGIYVIEVEKTNQTDADGAAVVNVSGSHLFQPQSPMANYCISSLVCDSEGTIYYKNDSGYIMAVGRKADVPQPSAPLALSASGESVELVETALTGEDFTGNSTISGKIYKAVVPRDAAEVTMTANADLYAAASASMEGASKRAFEGGKIDVERAKFGSYVLDKQNPKYFNAEKLAGEVLTTQKVLYLSFFETEESYGAKEAAFGLLLQFGDGSEGALPTVTINAPAQTDTGARFSGAELPASFTVDSETRQVKLSVDSWDKNAYDFAGWSINGGAPAAEFKITQDTAGWEDYVDGDFTLQALGGNQLECTFHSPVLLQNITISPVFESANAPYQVTVYAPEGKNVAFYPTTGFGADNRDQFDLQKQILPESEKTEDGYHVYSLTLRRGTYSFRGTDALGRDVGGMSFQVPAEQTGGGTSSREDTKIYLRLAEFTVTNEYDGQKAGEEDFNVTVQSKSGVSTTGGAYEDNEGYTCYPALLYANGNAQLYYFTLAPSAAYANAHSVAAFDGINQAVAASADVYEVAKALPGANTVTINAPEGAEVSVYKQVLNYNTVLVTGGTKTPAANGTVDHTYKIGASKYSYRASMEGKVTQAGYLDRKTNVTVTFDEENSPKTQEPSKAANHEASLLLNLNERNKLALGVGESFKVRAYRGAWQIVNTIVDNVMIEPDFHFTVLSGEDVISITQTNGGNAGGNWAFITAKKEGVAIVEVTYDAMNIDGTAATGNGFYGAANPARTGVFAVTVGGDYADVGGVAWDSEYNTCYFLDDAGSLTINPVGEDVTVSAANVWNGEMGQWQAAEKTANGFDVPIGQGNNVVKITSGGVTDYRVIRGARLTPVIEGPNADGKIYPGDEVTLSFEGLFQPAPKFAGMYNPGFGNSMKVNYRLGEENLASGGTQYGLIDKNGHKITFTVPQNAEAALTLSGGKITGTVMGNSYGKHRTITDVGVPANFNASGLPLEELPLPDVTVTVTRPATDEAKTQAKEAINTAFAKYNKDKYTSSNWEKLVAAKDKGLADIDAAADLSAVTAAKNETLLAMSSIPQKSSGGGDKPDAGGIDKTHTKSYYKTTGLNFDISGNAEGTVTISFSDYGERLYDADFETPLGVLIAPTEVPYKKGDTIADVTVRLLKALGIGYSNTGTVDSGFYLSSIKDFYLSDGYKVKSFGEFDAGAASGWMISQNNWFINRSAADYKVEDGDLIKWQYTCQLGADIGCDMSKPSAKITGLNFKKDYGTLSPKFSKSEKNYTYTVSSSVKSICLEAEQENYWAVLTYTADGEKYKPMEPIPVEDGTVIKLDCAFAEFAGDKPSDTDSVTITVKVKGSTSTPGGQTKPSGGKTTETKPQVESPVIKPEAKLDETGEAKAAVEQKDVTGAVSKAKTNKAAGIVIWPQGAEDAKKVSVSLPAASAKAVSDAGLSLCVKTDIASITLPSEAVKAAAGQAKDTVTICAEQKGEGVLLSVSADGEAILEMPGGIAASVATQKTGEGLTAVLVGEDGSETVLKKSVIENGEVYMLLPGSATVKIVDNTKTFDDVDADFWGAKAICFTAARGLFEGTSERTFGPGEPMSRGMLVTVLHRLEDSPAPQQSAGFTDVADGAWYYDAVCWANENNIVNGISGTEFAPGQALTRQTLATILYRYAKTVGLATGEKDSLESFADGADTADWAKEAMGWAVSAGLINGRDGGILDPGAGATRAEVSAILQRLIKIMVIPQA